jgi:hypothetical protein
MAKTIVKKSITSAPKKTTIEKFDEPFDLIANIKNWAKDIFIGKAPEIDDTHIEKGHLSPALKTRITKNINEILRNKTGRNYKFGKTGFAPIRVDQKDYRKASYKNMYILYQSTSANYVEQLECYYSKNHTEHELNDNIDTDSRGRMRSYNKQYYLYMVV